MDTNSGSSTVEAKTPLQPNLTTSADLSHEVERSTSSDDHCNEDENPLGPFAGQHLPLRKSQLDNERPKFQLHLKQLLPQKIPEPILACKDLLNDELKLFKDDSFHAAVRKKILMLYGANARKTERKHFERVDLTLPTNIPSSITSDKNLLHDIFKACLEVVASVETLVLPELGIDLLQDLICAQADDDKIFADGTNCSSVIEIPFTAASANSSPKRNKDALLAVLEALYDSLKPTEMSCKPSSDAVVFLGMYENHQKQELFCQELLKDSALLAQSGVEVTATWPLSKSALLKEARNKPKDEKDIESAAVFTAYNYWHLDKLWAKKGFFGEGTTIAILDSGIDPSHPAFRDQVINADDRSFKDFCSGEPTQSANDHGIRCAGIACGKKFNCFKNPASKETVEKVDFPPGVAPKAKLMVFKVAYNDTTFFDSNWTLKALEWILDNQNELKIDVISMSLGNLLFKPKIAKIINKLLNENIIIVCAAANSGQQYSQPINFPAQLGHVLCIGSHGPNGKPSDFSPVGQQIDFLAPGENVAAPSNSHYDHHYHISSGTSYAAPAVAGLICLILACIKDQYKYSPETYMLFKNQWAMKEVLREISTSPGHHSSDRGFGALVPLKLFQDPMKVLNSVKKQVLQF